METFRGTVVCMKAAGALTRKFIAGCTVTWRVRYAVLRDVEFLIRALSLRGTVGMDHTLSREDKGNFAALVQSCHTGYVLAGRDKANDAFDRDTRLIKLKEEVLEEFENLQQRSSKKYDRGVQMYHWRN